MGKCVAYVAAAIVFIGIGALVAGVCVWFLAPRDGSIQGIQEIRHARCVFQSKYGISGIVHLEEFGPGQNNPLTINANISGLSAGLHGFHIHAFGMPENGDCMACGGHYNPKGFNHSAPTSPERHVGDLGNINSTADSDITIVHIDDPIASLWGHDSIVGRSVVVHADEDDFGLIDSKESRTTGSAGLRLACCTIYLIAN
ncbi:hypothetical protein SK128_025113 [Halocaridina rubra]|uniref:Superoxide dismutase copper/zinc binding domain-containing protein n=1 Tax=Halocaridina rubra TaxID=373956 RepID=A0AAN8WFM0_HALRR